MPVDVRILAVVGLGDAEVDDLHAAVEGDEEVRGAHVSVDEAERPAAIGERVREVQAARGGAQERERDVDGDVLLALLGLPEHLRHRAARQELHDEQRIAGVVVDEERLHEVVVQEPQRTRPSSLQHRGLVQVVRVIGDDALDDDEAGRDPERGIAGEVREQDVAHAALREAADDSVSPPGELFAHAGPGPSARRRRRRSASTTSAPASGRACPTASARCSRSRSATAARDTPRARRRRDRTP